MAKKNVLNALQEILETSKLSVIVSSRYFGVPNLFQCLTMQKVVEVYLIAREVPGHPY